MFFSPALIEELVVDLANVTELNPDTVRNLIYHLKLPGDAIPSFIARVIAERPGIGQRPSYFPGRLAYGIVDNSLLLYDLSERYDEQAKLCRQVERIRLNLEKLEHPAGIIDIFTNRLSLMVFATAAATDLGSSDRRLSKAELGILVERIVEAVLVQTEVMKHLLERIVGGLHRTQKHLLAIRVEETIREAMDNVPWDDTLESDPIFDLHEPVRFRLSLCEQNLFPEAARTTSEHISRLCYHH